MKEAANRGGLTDNQTFAARYRGGWRPEFSRSLTCVAMPICNMRGNADLPDLLEKFISLWPWL
jgi:hypothetical protein